MVYILSVLSLGNEAALFMRLHLLQGIILYHQNNREAAIEMLRKAEEEMKILKVNENSLMMLVELGMKLSPNVSFFLTVYE